MITVIDLNICNIASVSRSLKKLGQDHKLTSDPADIAQAEKLILPGVGNFAEGMKRMNSLGIIKVLREQVLQNKIPVMGICLGMELLFSYGDEGGGTEGLDLIKGHVSYHRASESDLRLPHIGWNDMVHENFDLFQSIPEDACFYFVHSYEAIPEEPAVVAYCNYGVNFVAAIKKDNIIGVQFHPEKSQGYGLKLLRNYCDGNY